MSKLQIVQQIIVCGPTASGKTDLAIKLAKENNGELINADSRQIYKYLDIGTNKGNIIEHDGKYFIDDIPIHLISFLNPDQEYSVVDYVQTAEAKIKEIKNNDKLPIIVGGTGLYIDALIRGYEISSEQTDRRLRNELNSLTVEQLQARVLPERLAVMNDSDRQNPRRLIRAIEKSNYSVKTQVGGNYDYRVIFIDKSLAEIEQKLHKRVEQMWQAGLVDEVREVMQTFSENAVALEGIGYRQVLAFLHGEISEEDCKKQIYIAHRQYAKRQLTWFHKYLKLILPNNLQKM